MREESREWESGEWVVDKIDKMKWVLVLFSLLFFCCLVVFQNKLVYSCGLVKQQLPPQAFGLPEPWYKFNGAVTSFLVASSNKSIYFFHGNGIRAENTWWHVGRLFGICNCNVHVIENLDCLEPATWFGHSQRDISYHAHLILRNLLNKNHTNIIVAVSLGTAVAMSALDELSIDKIVLENPFTSVGDLIAHYTASFQFPSALIFRIWKTKLFIRSVTQPLLILTSENDEIVPPSMSLILINAAKNSVSKQHVVLRGALHGHAGAHPDYLPEIAKFIK